MNKKPFDFLFFSKNKKQHENYRELIWMLAKTDFKLRYQGSVLGYAWALLKPLLMFLILNFVFSALFNMRANGIEHYSLQLLVSIMMFNFFSEGTSAGMNSLLAKSQLVTKIYVPRWSIIFASTLNSAMIFCMNLLVIALFFAWYGYMPSIVAIATFLLFAVSIFVLVVSFSLLTAPILVRLRDLSLIWEVLVSLLFYATPVFYPLQMLPGYIQQILLLNPMAFIIHFTKEALANNHFAEPWQYAVFAIILFAGFAFSVFSYRKLAPRVAEEM